MSRFGQACICAGLVIVGYVCGRYAQPEKVITKTVEVEKKVEDKKSETEKHKTTKTVEVTQPDGGKTVTTVVEEDTNKHSDKNSTTDTTKNTTVETTRGADITLSLLGGLNFPNTPVYGLSFTKPVLGPITLGVWGLSDKTLGASIGLTF